MKCNIQYRMNCNILQKWFFLFPFLIGDDVKWISCSKYFFYLSVIHFTEQINLHLSNQHISNEWATKGPPVFLCFKYMFLYFHAATLLMHFHCRKSFQWNNHVLNLLIESVWLIKPSDSLRGVFLIHVFNIFLIFFVFPLVTDGIFREIG